MTKIADYFGCLKQEKRNIFKLSRRFLLLTFIKLVGYNTSLFS